MPTATRSACCRILRAGSAELRSGGEPAHVDGDEDEQEHDHDAVERHERDAPRVPARTPPPNAEEVERDRDHTDHHADDGADAAGDPEHGQDPREHDVREQAPRPRDHDGEAEEARRLVLIGARGLGGRARSGPGCCGRGDGFGWMAHEVTDCLIGEWTRASGGQASRPWQTTWPNWSTSSTATGWLSPAAR